VPWKGDRYDEDDFNNHRHVMLAFCTGDEQYKAGQFTTG
jgi:hypothetical protein